MDNEWTCSTFKVISHFTSVASTKMSPRGTDREQKPWRLREKKTEGLAGYWRVPCSTQRPAFPSDLLLALQSAWLPCGTVLTLVECLLHDLTLSAGSSERACLP